MFQWFSEFVKKISKPCQECEPQPKKMSSPRRLSMAEVINECNKIDKLLASDSTITGENRKELNLTRTKLEELKVWTAMSEIWNAK